MSKNLKVIQTTSRVLEIIYKVVGILCLVGAIGSLIGIAFLIISGSFPSIAEKITSESNRTVSQLIGDCLVGFIIAASSFVVCKAHRDFFAMEQKIGTPFTMECAKAFRTLGIIDVVFPISLAIVTSIVSAIFKCWNDIRLDVSIGAGVAMILISFVFAYGAELKQGDGKEVAAPETDKEGETK
ncbi:MAG: hypothetical protein IKS77_02890 [Spirochaetales bacterium]|nr:hypothetical protein [Spirochaetales bacterium]